MLLFHDVQTPWFFWFRLLGRMVITEVFSAHWGGPNSCHQGRVLAVLWDELTENLGEMGTTNGNSMEFFMKEMDINWKFFTSGQKWA